MLPSPYHSIANLASSLNRTIRLYCNLSDVSSHSQQSAQPHIPPLVLPQTPDILPGLLQLGLSDSLALECHSMFVDAMRKMDVSLQESYQTQVPLICENEQSPQASRLGYIQVFNTQLLASREECMKRLWNTVVSLAQERQQRLSSSSNTPSPGPSGTSQSLSPASSASSSKGRKVRPHNFSKQQTAALQALLAHDDKYSADEKDFIAEKLNLTREQVNRWFCNARARRYKPYSRPGKRGGSSSLGRTVQESSSSESTQSGLSDQSSAESSRATSPTRSSSSADPSLASPQPPSDSQQPLPDADQMDLYFDFDALEKADQNVDLQLPPEVDNLFDFNLLDQSCNPLGPSCNPQGPLGNPIDSSLYLLDPSFNPFDPSSNPLLNPSNPPLDPSFNPLFPSQYTSDISMWMC